jgi:uncharacterized protein (TIGR02118 family)
MIKRMTLLVRKDELSHPQFGAYWLQHHGAIVKQMPLVAGYVQNVITKWLVIDSANHSFMLDGIVELWFSDESSKTAAFNSAAAKLLPKDELNFIKGITIFSINENVLIPGSSGNKIMLLFRLSDVKGGWNSSRS